MVCSSADDKCLVVDLFLNQKLIETICCLYHQKKDFVSVPYEPNDAGYLIERI